MPKISSASTEAQIEKLYNFLMMTLKIDVQPQIKNLEVILRGYLFQNPNYGRNKTTLSERQRGWHKEHYNYNKAEKWELPPSLRRTPARNVTKTGAKRKRATTIKKYK